MNLQRFSPPPERSTKARRWRAAWVAQNPGSTTESSPQWKKLIYAPDLVQISRTFKALKRCFQITGLSRTLKDCTNPVHHLRNGQVSPDYITIDSKYLLELEQFPTVSVLLVKQMEHWTTNLYFNDDKFHWRCDFNDDKLPIMTAFRNCYANKLNPLFCCLWCPTNHDCLYCLSVLKHVNFRKGIYPCYTIYSNNKIAAFWISLQLFIIQAFIIC